MAYPSRRRDDPYAQDAFYGRNPPYWEAGDPPAAPPPRRSKSERHRRRPSPDDKGASSRRHRDDDMHRSSRRDGDGRRPRSPPPSNRYDDRYGGDSRRDPRDYRDSRDRDRDRDRDVRDHRDSRDPRGSRNDRDHRSSRYDDEPSRGHRRSRTAEDPGRYRRSSPDYKSRDYPPRDDRDRDRHGGKSSRARDISPTHGGRTKTRDFADDKDRDRDRHGGYSSRSNGKDKSTSKEVATKSPPRGREKHATTGTRSGPGGGFGGKIRSSTMPAAATAAKWWQNPLVQAGARTALSAGAQAAMNNRNAQGEWLGAKGAKVATAAIGAALMDGFMGGGGKDKYEKDGRDRGRSGSRDRGRDHSRDRDRSKDRGSRAKSSGRSKSEGRGGGIRDKILQSGMDFMMKKAAAR